MNGAEAMIRTLVDAGVTTCFTNPGTSEMHFVAALDEVPEMRGVLGLFEGVVTGAADGYARMAGVPAATLLHLGPGLGNGLANLHNARRASTPMVNIVGDHATYHAGLDAPLNSDIETAARNVSGWIRRPERTTDLCRTTAEAVAAAIGPPGQVATLILPADVSWSDGATPVAPEAVRRPAAVDGGTVELVAKLLRSGEPVALLLGGSAMRRPSLDAAGRIATATGARLIAETFVARTERGAGIPAAEKLQYFGEMALQQLGGLRHLVLVDAPVAGLLLRLPGQAQRARARRLRGPRARDGRRRRRRIARRGRRARRRRLDGTGARLAAGATDRRAHRSVPRRSGRRRHARGRHRVRRERHGRVWMAAATAGCPPHDWLQLTGGAIGQGLPLATGAAVACPDRPVLSLEADGSAMYTIQALWTQARESLDVTTVILNNRSYAILNIELARTGAGGGGPKAKDLLDLSRPDLDFVHLASGMGVPAVAVHTADEAVEALQRAIAEPGPHLVEARLG